MYNLIWRYRIPPAAQPAFEIAYGHAGTWSTFFKQSDAYFGTQLYKDAAIAIASYMVIDQWQSKEAYDNFLVNHADAYKQLSKQCEYFYDAEERLVDFIS